MHLLGESVMSRGSNGTVLKELDRLFSEGTLAGLSIGQLLERFASRRDETCP